MEAGAEARTPRIEPGVTVDDDALEPDGDLLEQSEQTRQLAAVELAGDVRLHGVEVRGELGVREGIPPSVGENSGRSSARRLEVVHVRDENHEGATLNGASAER